MTADSEGRVHFETSEGFRGIRYVFHGRNTTDSFDGTQWSLGGDHAGVITHSETLTILGPPEYVFVAADSTINGYQLPTGTDLIEFRIVQDTVRVLRWRFRMG